MKKSITRWLERITRMNALTVTAKGQITLKKDLLQHLGIHPGDKLSIDKMPGGEVRIRADRPSGSIADFCGSLKREGQPSLSIEEMNEIIAKGWAGEL
ncbi:AbrB/MazE/SpoVT family DNA-binding domain-containing protein [Rhizorhapis sp.]|uniref:AbrB/MazE/SpoVT family DNA-binding domain-containing protein n=1 Tax=Rhizorhapis sp. TaxID=1968842 RepID=UPI0039C9F21E